MLDTIVLTLDRHQFAIKEPDLFTPSAKGLIEEPYYPFGGQKMFKCTFNPTKELTQKHGYLPRLTLIRAVRNGGHALGLRIEFSAPKIMFGNNFDELDDGDFESFIKALDAKLYAMGILCRPSDLREVKVSKIDYSKNIIITDYTTCSMIIDELHKVDLTKRLDLANTDYRNNGQAIRYHANSFEMAFYDKLKDLEQAKKSEKRALEKDNAMQFDLFESGRFPKNLQVLRYELRLGNRRKIKADLRKVGVDCDLTLENLFSKTLAQKLLRHYWQEITSMWNMLAMSHDKPEDLFRILHRNHDLKLNKIFQIVGMAVIQKSVGVRGLRSLIEEVTGSEAWYRLKRDIEKLDLPKNHKFHAVGHIERTLTEFKPVKLADHELG